MWVTFNNNSTAMLLTSLSCRVKAVHSIQSVFSAGVRSPALPRRGDGWQCWRAQQSGASASDLFGDGTLGSILNRSFFWFVFSAVFIIVAALPSPAFPVVSCWEGWLGCGMLPACNGARQPASVRASGDTFWGSAEAVEMSRDVSS